MSFGTLVSGAASLQVLNARLLLPQWGVGSAYVTLARGDTELSGSVVLTVGPIVFTGTIRRGGPFTGRGTYQIFGGGDGWGLQVPANSYRNSQTLLSTLLQDVASLVGETIVMQPGADRIVGALVRMVGPASRTLNQYVPGRWWVELDGTTHVGDRIVTPASVIRVLDYHPEIGLVEVSDDSAIMLPGQTFVDVTGNVSGAIQTVAVNLDGSRLRTELWLQ